MTNTLTLTCADGTRLHGHLWTPTQPERGTIIINPATGVRATYYHYYARFLAEHGFAVLTYDYRGIGASRPANMRGVKANWRVWGEQDFNAAIAYARHRAPTGTLAVIGHSIGGFLIGFAPLAGELTRILTVGAQYAYWPDYAPAQRVKLLAKWHLTMPLLTSLFGYFPGKRLGWLEDIPAGIAHEWSFRRARLESSYPAQERTAVLASFAAVRAPTLALSTTDDEFATPAAMHRALAYYKNSDRQFVHLTPQALGFPAIGHFNLFHARHQGGFWTASLRWLQAGENPWPAATTHFPAGD